MNPREKDNLLREICNTFIDFLITKDLIFDEQIFYILSDVAEKRNLKLSAHQQGIQGTHIVFEEGKVS